ncbi:hypothetical protein LTR95_008688 [Oleoguttula sp. CCFEE 5521]
MQVKVKIEGQAFYSASLLIPSRLPTIPSAMPGICSLHLSPSFVLSSGTVTLDVNRRKVLLIRCCNSSETLLPKGRKNKGETLDAAALRETYEETGYRATLLPLAMATLATSEQSTDRRAASDGDDGLSPHTEAVAVTQRSSHRAHKIIFWFAATAESLAMPDADTQQEGENFQASWVSFEESQEKLTFDDDKAVAQYVIDAVASAHRHSTLPTI